MRDSLTELRIVDRLATLGGLLTTLGVISPDALRWDSVIEESELAHIIIIGELAIVFPKPLDSVILEPTKDREEEQSQHRHPTQSLRAGALQDICHYQAVSTPVN